MQKAHQCIATMPGTHRLVSLPKIALENEAENQSKHKQGCQMPTVFLSKNHELDMGPFPNIAKGTTDPRVKFISQVITQILINQFQNFD